MYEALKAVALWLGAAMLAWPLGGCATTPAPADTGSFAGSWHVPWCHPTRTDLECGGFSITLVEKEGRICGTYFGARVNLNQVDEGMPDSIRGVRVGDVAVMTIESARSGDIHLVRAELAQNGLTWKIVDEVHEADGDIDIIAMDDVLQRDPNVRSDVTEEVARGCRL